jgi:hypothetical protein
MADNDAGNVQRDHDEPYRHYGGLRDVPWGGAVLDRRDRDQTGESFPD